MNNINYNKPITSKELLKHVEFLDQSRHKIDLINYLHDLNEQLKAGKKLQHFIHDDVDDYYTYFKTNLNKVHCHDTYACKETEFEEVNIGLMLSNESDNEFMFEDGKIYIDECTNEVLWSLYCNGYNLIVYERNYNLYYAEITHNERNILHKQYYNYKDRYIA